MKCCGRLDSRGQWHLGAANPLSSGGPTTTITGVTHYVDLYTDTMYEQRAGSWAVIMKHGKPVDEHGNIIEEHLYY